MSDDTRSRLRELPERRVIIAGPRDLDPSSQQVSRAVLASGFSPTEIVFGGYSGVDFAGEQWARLTAEIPFHVIPARWKHVGNGSAGPQRNAKLAKYADALIVIRRWNQRTSGTGSMIAKARVAGLPIHVEEVTA